MEYVAVVGDFGAVLGSVDLGSADQNAVVDFLVDIVVHKKRVRYRFDILNRIFYYMAFTTNIGETKQCSIVRNIGRVASSLVNNIIPHFVIN